MNKVLHFLQAALEYIIAMIIAAWEFSRDFFLSLSIWNRIILIMSFSGIAGVLIPVATFDILDLRYPVNNPLSITLIFIVLLYDVSIFFSGKYLVIIRLVLAVYYGLHFSLLFITGTVTQAEPYTIAIGFYVNIAIAIAYGVLSVLDYYYGNH